jgi:hypothetical protein
LIDRIDLINPGTEAIDQVAAGVGPWATRAGLPKVIQTPAETGLRLEPQACLSGVLQSEIEQTTQRQATTAKQEFGTAVSESNDE